MPRLTINGQHIDAAENASVLDAAREAGIGIPTLCHYAGVEPQTSCMMCVVRDAATGRTLLSCATRAAEGMDIVTDDDGVRALRRDTLALLLAEHAGDCEGPCERACPAGLRTPQMLRCLQQGDEEVALAIAREDLLFPALLGRICAAPCERVCRRGQYDSAIAIRTLHGELAETHPGLLLTRSQDRGKKVAVIGAGLAGLAATRMLAHMGYACRLYEKEDVLCPDLRDAVPQSLLEAEFAFVEAWGVEYYLKRCVALGGAAGEGPTLASCMAENDAVVIALKDTVNGGDPRVVHAREEKMPVRAVAAGKRAALEIHALLINDPAPGKRPFNSHLGRLADDELDAYRKNRGCIQRTQGGCCATDGTESGPPPEHHTAEAMRCLHCDCLKPDTCALRRYAGEYGAAAGGRHGMSRLKIAPIERAGAVLYEPGKCIKCGICVAITRRHGIQPGMAMTRRGLASQLRAALGATLAEGLGAAADECVRACPTAALAWEHESDSSNG